MVAPSPIPFHPDDSAAIALVVAVIDGTMAPGLKRVHRLQ